MTRTDVCVSLLLMQKLLLFIGLFITYIGYCQPIPNVALLSIPGITNSYNINFSWTPVSTNITSYQAVIGTNAGEWHLTNTVPGSQTNTIFTNLVSGQQYAFAVRGIANTVTGLYSAPLYAEIPAIPQSIGNVVVVWVQIEYSTDGLTNWKTNAPIPFVLTGEPANAMIRARLKIDRVFKVQP